MEQTLLKDIPVEGDFPIAHLLRITDPELKKTKKGDKEYLAFTLADASTSFKWCKKWDSNKDEYERVKKLQVVFVTGQTNVYNDNLSIVCESLAAPDDSIDIDFLLDTLMPKTTYEVSFLKKGIWSLIQSMENPWIKKLCESFVTDKEIMTRFSLVPAGVARHHSFKHGLLEHTYRLMVIAEDFVASYNKHSWPGNKVFVDRDTVLASTLLHDMMKCREYEIDGSYAIEGNMLGHISRCIMEIGIKTNQIEDFPQDLKELMVHNVSAHHGQVDWGSPDTPCCPEAIITHYLDNLCSKLDPTILELNTLAADSKWTENRVKALGKVAHLGNSFLKEE